MGVGDIVGSFGKYLSNSFCMMNGFVKIELPSDRSVRRIPRNIPFSLLVTVYLAESHRKKDTAYVGPKIRVCVYPNNRVTTRNPEPLIFAFTTHHL